MHSRSADPRVVRAEDLESLFDLPVVAHRFAGTATPGDVHPEEAALVASAVAKRQHEFAAGRLCAHASLACLGVTSAPILRAGSAPIWPAGSLGSISHTQGEIAAVACRSSLVRGLGIDIEWTDRVHQKLERQICVEREVAWLDARGSEERSRYAALIFSAKEAFYKCQYSVTEGWLGFRDAWVEIGEGTFTIRLTDPESALPGELHELSGAYRFDEPYVYTAIALACP